MVAKRRFKGLMNLVLLVAVLFFGVVVTVVIQANTTLSGMSAYKVMKNSTRPINIVDNFNSINTVDNFNCPPVSDDEESLIDIYGARVGGKLAAMGKMNACLSFKQLSKFSSVKDKVMAWVRSHPEKNLLPAQLPNRNFYAIEVNDDYAYLHIWKNGGTTVNAVTHRNHTKPTDLGGRTLFTTVRNPIDHFLSGWAECGFRSENPDEDPSFTLDTGINERIASWLDKLEEEVVSQKSKHPCYGHSLPQASFMLDPHNNEKFISPKLEIIGDLHELSAMLEMVGFTKPPKKRARSASDNHIKVDRYPKDIRLLSDQTVQRICKFVMVDYLFFDFEPPSPCREIVQSYVEMVWYFEIKSFSQHQ